MNGAKKDIDPATDLAEEDEEQNLPDFEPAAEHARKTVVDCRFGGSGRRRREACEKPQDDHERQDDRADAAQEDARALPQAERKIAQIRPPAALPKLGIRG